MGSRTFHQAASFALPATGDLRCFGWRSASPLNAWIRTMTSGNSTAHLPSIRSSHSAVLSGSTPGMHDNPIAEHRRIKRAGSHGRWTIPERGEDNLADAFAQGLPLLFGAGAAEGKRTLVQVQRRALGRQAGHAAWAGQVVMLNHDPLMRDRPRPWLACYDLDVPEDGTR